MNIRPSYSVSIEESFDVKGEIKSRNNSSFYRPSGSSLSLRQHSINPRRSISSSKEPKSALTKSFFENRYAIGLTVDELRQIYHSKCHDLKIRNFPDQEKRFFSYCWMHFKDRKLNMSEMGIATTSAKTVGNILKNNPNYAYVNLSKNSIKDEGAIELLSNISKSLNIVHVDISSNDITPEGSKTVLDMVKDSQSIVSLDISSHEGLHRNRLCKEGGSSLGKLLSTNKILMYLNISGTALGSDGTYLMLKGLENNTSLFSLDLSSNNLGPKVIESLAMAIVKTEIRELNLSSNSVGNEGSQYIALMLSGAYGEYTIITKLYLENNEITTKGLHHLLESIRINNVLSFLSLKKNNFLKGLSSNFLQFLTDNLALETIDLSACELNCEGLRSIAEGISKNKMLKTLLLQGNKIKDKGVEMIAHRLVFNKFLKTLDLSVNLIKNKGAVALSKVLRTNNVIENLLLKDNNIKDIGGQALCDAVRINKQIQRVSLELNPLNFKFITEIKNLLHYNVVQKIQSVIPRLNEALERSKIRGNEIYKVQEKISQKSKERQDAEKKLAAQGEKLKTLREQEKEKFDEINKELVEVKARSIELNREISQLEHQLNVKFKQRVHINGEKNVSEISGKIGAVVNQIKQHERTSKY